MKLFYALQFEYFGHNSFDFEAKIMGLTVLESLFYALSLSCFEFSHLKCRDFMKQILRTTVSGIRD